jgi:peptidoglycan/LPS O-acetylase OafA/YrhL
MERRVRGFDGIRGLAALSIVVRHVGLLDNLDAHGLGFLMPLLVTGVPWFYVLWGFLITTLLLRDTGRISL